MALGGSELSPKDLVVMTLNLQYFASYPKDEKAAHQELMKKVVAVDTPPDVICVQEGLASKDVLSLLGYEKVVCAGEKGVAQSVREMVYSDAPTLNTCDEKLHDELLCNQIYVRQGSSWKIQDKTRDCGTMQTSSDSLLVGGGGRAQGKLAVRSMAWVKMTTANFPAVYVMCTHISGGRFEDQYFVQQLAEERRLQIDRCIAFFNKERLDPSADDIGILVGDYNATTTYDPAGPMSSYFNFAIAGSDGVKADAVAAVSNGIKLDLENQFKEYMLSPFAAIKKNGWSFAYGPEIGITSGFGHLIDHMATNRPLQIADAEVIYLTNQKFGNKPPDTDLQLTDHNSVKTVFRIPNVSDTSFRSNRLGIIAAVTACLIVAAVCLQYGASGDGLRDSMGHYLG